MLRGCRYETIEEMKEAMAKVIDTLTQEDFYGAFGKFLERYNKRIEAGRAYFEGELEFHVCTINKSAHTKKSGNLFNDPHFLVFSFLSFCIYISIYLSLLLCLSLSVSLYI